jgi:sulfopyruvate decarboxylase TPP-binding subunit
MSTSRASAVARLLESLDVTHLVTIPDNTSALLLEALEGATIRTLYATREGEAVALASGLWLGGARPVVLIQNTGLLESGDGLRGAASRLGAPLLLLVTTRGYAVARAAGVVPGAAVLSREALVRADLDSVALMTEQTLDAWGVPFHRLEDATDLSAIGAAWERAHSEERPVAVLIDATFS